MCFHIAACLFVLFTAKLYYFCLYSFSVCCLRQNWCGLRIWFRLNKLLEAEKRWTVGEKNTPTAAALPSTVHVENVWDQRIRNKLRHKKPPGTHHSHLWTVKAVHARRLEMFEEDKLSVSWEMIWVRSYFHLKWKCDLVHDLMKRKEDKEQSQFQQFILELQLQLKKSTVERSSIPVIYPWCKTTGEGKVCDFLEPQAIIWEDNVSSIGNYLYMTGLIYYCKKWWELLCSKAADQPCAGPLLWLQEVTPVQKHHPMAVHCQSAWAALCLIQTWHGHKRRGNNGIWGRELISFPFLKLWKLK